MTTKKIKNLFLSQSYSESWKDYETSLTKENYIRWDYIILTASNDEQAENYRKQINYRLDNGLLPKQTKYAVLPDTDGKRIGSGGATLNVLKYLAEDDNNNDVNHFANKRILVIHSGGDSKRIPQYSASGKLFSPIPRQLPNGRGSTLFDEFIINLTTVPSRFKEGMLVLSGDVLLLFNPLQIDFNCKGAAAISIKECVETGKNHGVFLSDESGYVANFLHKQSEEKLKEMGAVNENNMVNLDTGAVILDSFLLNSLFSLISTNNEVDENKFNEFVNDEARISFYGDFLYPLAKNSTLEQYYKEAAEGTINVKLLACRTKIWNSISDYKMKLICMSPAEFIHFGTTHELLDMVTENYLDYEFLGWNNQVLSTRKLDKNIATFNAYISKNSQIGKDSYIEHSFIDDNSVIGNRCIISNLKIENKNIPSNTVLHGLNQKNNKYVVRIYSVNENPKTVYSKKSPFLGTTLPDFVLMNNISYSDLFENDEDYLWFAKLYPACNTMEEALRMSLIVYKMSLGTATEDEILEWKNSNRESLYSCFNNADNDAINLWQKELVTRIKIHNFTTDLNDGVYYKDALEEFGTCGIDEEVFKNIMLFANKQDFFLKIRIYYAVAQYMKENKKVFFNKTYDEIETICFDTIQKTIYDETVKNLNCNNNYKIKKDYVKVELPVRVNFGGGWTDTPPYCNENGGAVLNAAIKLNGIYPIQIVVKKIDKPYIEFESEDIGVKGIVKTVEEIRDCHNPYDSFALHKAALIASGIIPLEGDANLQDILNNMGGGIYLSTCVIGIPKGSGLGTSSILSAACIKGIFEFVGKETTPEEIYDVVLGMEQIMSTGGGWQDQVGGLTNGLKFIVSDSGITQKLNVQNVNLSDETKKELQDRFALIYTGQRRLARNLLRDVVGNYIGNRKESVEALKNIEILSSAMKFELERGRVDNFAKLLNKHWELSKKLDNGSTNVCIEYIFMSIADLVDGEFICGAGGGGFLQVILKKGVTHKMLKDRLFDIFQDSGIDVWNTEFVW